MHFNALIMSAKDFSKIDKLLWELQKTGHMSGDNWLKSYKGDGIRAKTMAIHAEREGIVKLFMMEEGVFNIFAISATDKLNTFLSEGGFTKRHKKERNNKVFKFFSSLLKWVLSLIKVY